MRQKIKELTIDRVKYKYHTIGKTNLGYGTVGSNKKRIIRARDNYCMGNYNSIKEFREDRAYFKKLAKKNAKR